MDANDPSPTRWWQRKQEQPSDEPARADDPERVRPDHADLGSARRSTMCAVRFW